MLLELCIVFRNHASFRIEHRRKYASANRTRRQQILFFLTCLGNQLRTKPCFYFFFQLRFIGTYPPRQPIVSSCEQRHIGFTILDAAHHLCRIPTDLDAQSHSNLFRKALTQQVLSSKIMTMIIIIGLWTRHGQNNHFAITHNLLQVKICRQRILLLSPRCELRFFLLVLACSTQKQESKNVYIYSLSHQFIKISLQK